MKRTGRTKQKRFLLWVVWLICAAVLLSACSAGGMLSQGGSSSTDKGGLGGEISSEASENGIDSTGRKIIQTYNGTLYVSDATAAAGQIRQALGKFTDAYIESSSIVTEQQDVTARFKLRVRSEDLDAFIAEIHLAGEVRDESRESEDVTKSYIDLEAKKEAKEAEEKRLLELYDKAVSIADINAVSAQLAVVQAELNSINSMLLKYDSLVALSTVNLTIYQKMPPAAEQSFGDKVGRAFKDSGRAVAVFFEYLFLILIYVGPFLLIGVAIFCAIFFTLRYLKKKKAKALNAQNNEPPNDGNVNGGFGQNDETGQQ